MGGGNEAHSLLYPFFFGYHQQRPEEWPSSRGYIIGVWKVDKFSAAIDNYVNGFDFQRKPVSLFAAVGNIWWIDFHLCHQDGNRMQVGAQKTRLLCENASQVAEIVYGVYDADTVIANCVQFWFGRFRSGIIDVEDASRTGRPIDENVDKITEIIEVD
ncbi:hypothetical protein TNCV_171571 [Trichonephila clavipes]|nr:hypothetical protein TNCV_171571 [Trichonephila clavipes]